MNARFHLPIVALCIAGALAGCASVTQGTQFQPPTGWGGIPAIMGRFQIWFKQGQNKGEGQFLFLVKTNAKDSNNTTDFNQIETSSNTKDLKVLAHGPTKFCGSQPGEEYRAEGTNSSDGKKVMFEMTSSVIGSDRYLAVYVRPVAVAADQQAEKAIRSLCPVAK